MQVMVGARVLPLLRTSLPSSSPTEIGTLNFASDCLGWTEKQLQRTGVQHRRTAPRKGAGSHFLQAEPPGMGQEPVKVLDLERHCIEFSKRPRKGTKASTVCLLRSVAFLFWLLLDRLVIVRAISAFCRNTEHVLNTPRSVLNDHWKQLLFGVGRQKSQCPDPGAKKIGGSQKQGPDERQTLVLFLQRIRNRHFPF